MCSMGQSERRMAPKGDSESSVARGRRASHAPLGAGGLLTRCCALSVLRTTGTPFFLVTSSPGRARKGKANSGERDRKIKCDLTAFKIGNMVTESSTGKKESL